MKVLVTGFRGFVGARIMECIDAVPAPSLRGMTKEDIARLIDREQPDVVIHTAAISDIGTCEKYPEASYRANVEQPVWIAAEGVRTIFFSSDQVYSGCGGEGPYKEEETAPANRYARQKLEMEESVLFTDPRSILLRATWMYDMPIYGIPNRGNFLMNMLRNQEIHVSFSQHRALTYVREVAAHMKEVIDLPGGIYNYGSENERTMGEVALWLKQELDLPVILKDAGERHALWMDCSKLKEAGIHFNNTIDGLKQCIQDYQL